MVKAHSEKTKIKIKLANKGYKWFNNGTVEVKSKNKPQGFEPGRLKTGKRWYTNGRETVLALKIPGDQWYIGRSKLGKDRKWYNDGKHNFLLEKVPFEQIKQGIYFYGMVRGASKKVVHMTKPTQPAVVGLIQKAKEPEIKMGEIKLMETPLTAAHKPEPVTEVKSNLTDYSMDSVKEVVKKQNGKLSISQLKDICNNMEFDDDKYDSLFETWGKN